MIDNSKYRCINVGVKRNDKNGWDQSTRAQHLWSVWFVEGEMWLERSQVGDPLFSHHGFSSPIFPTSYIEKNPLVAVTGHHNLLQIKSGYINVNKWIIDLQFNTSAVPILRLKISHHWSKDVQGTKYHTDIAVAAVGLSPGPGSHTNSHFKIVQNWIKIVQVQSFVSRSLGFTGKFTSLGLLDSVGSSRNPGFSHLRRYGRPSNKPHADLAHWQSPQGLTEQNRFFPYQPWCLWSLDLNVTFGQSSPWKGHKQACYIGESPMTEASLQTETTSITQLPICNTFKGIKVFRATHLHFLSAFYEAIESRCCGETVRCFSPSHVLSGGQPLRDREQNFNPCPLESDCKL